ncbi:MAG: hypothetical protein GY806_03450 [Gammaproteobacteria bacterium]|nr:hypothetical protein [Gammaproteobacteria bacterium]
MYELLIPFGIHRESGEIVEPEDAPKGRACDCLCPGCKAPLLSRHPKVNRYHFAHDSRHESARPEQSCPFSSTVAVAMMIRHLAPRLKGQVMQTPIYRSPLYFDCCSTNSLPVLISQSAKVMIEQSCANFSDKSLHFDLCLKVGDYAILVDLVYKGKPSVALRTAKLNAARAGVLELDCGKFSIASLKADRSRRFSDAVIDFILRDGLRTWRYHPRQEAMLNAAREKHQCRARLEMHYPDQSRRTVAFHKRLRHKDKIRQKPVEKPVTVTSYFCVLCNAEWVHRSNEELKCPDCHSHLYSRKVTE